MDDATYYRLVNAVTSRVSDDGHPREVVDSEGMRAIFDAEFSQMEALVAAAREAYSILGPRVEQPCSCDGCDCENGLAASALVEALAPFGSLPGRQGE